MQLGGKWKFREEMKKVFSASHSINGLAPFTPSSCAMILVLGEINEAALGEVFCGCAEQKGLTLPVLAAGDPPLSLKTEQGDISSLD